MLNTFKKLTRTRSEDLRMSRESVASENGMQSKETRTPKNYPPCNRAFALRMMNPTAYSDNNISPLDQEIKPLPKRRIAKGASLSRADSDGNSASFEENSFSNGTATISPTSSLASFQDMELYDIEEDGHVENSAFGMTRTKSMVDSFNRLVHNGTPKLNGVGLSEYAMTRSNTAIENFEEQDAFRRGSPHRVTMPGRVSNKRTRISNEPVKSETGYAEDGKKESPGSKADAVRTASANKSESKGLSRTNSLRERSRSEFTSVQSRASSNSRPNSVASSTSRSESTDVKGTKLHIVRSQKRDLPGGTADPRYMAGDGKRSRNVRTTPKSNSPSNTKHRPSCSDLSESDNSIVCSEADAYTPRRNPRRHPSSQQNGHTSSSQALVNDGSTGRQSFDASIDNITEYSSKAGSQKRAMQAASPRLNGTSANSDPFSRQLANICHLMSEKHPGEFQILESLVDMQAAYEAKEQQYHRLFRSLHDKIKELEGRLEVGERRRPLNISSIVLPLAKATTAFQKQLEEIMNMCDFEIAAHNFSVGVQANSERKGSIRDISQEANAVAEHISRMCLQVSPDNFAERESSAVGRPSSPVSRGPKPSGSLDLDASSGSGKVNVVEAVEVANDVTRAQNASNEPQRYNSRNHEVNLVAFSTQA